jgi:hypothetical protein
VKKLCALKKKKEDQDRDGNILGRQENALGSENNKYIVKAINN